MRECFLILSIDSNVVVKFELPKVEDLRLTTIEFDSRCSYLARNDTQKNSYFPKLLKYCLKLCHVWNSTKSK